MSNTCWVTQIWIHSFEDGDGDKEIIPVVYANTEKLVASIIKTRSYLGAMFVKVMEDGRQEFLKTCFTVLPEHYNPNLDLDTTEEED